MDNTMQQAAEHLPFHLPLSVEIANFSSTPAPAPAAPSMILPSGMTWASAAGAAFALKALFRVPALPPQLPFPSALPCWLGESLRQGVAALAAGMGRALCDEGQALLLQLPDAARSAGQLKAVIDSLRLCTSRRLLALPEGEAHTLDLTLLTRLWDLLLGYLSWGTATSDQGQLAHELAAEALPQLMANPLLLTLQQVGNSDWSRGLASALKSALLQVASSDTPGKVFTEDSPEGQLALERLPQLLTEARPRRFLRLLLPELSLPVNTLTDAFPADVAVNCRQLLKTTLPPALIYPLSTRCSLTPKVFGELNDLLGAGRTRVLLARLVQNPADNDAQVLADILRIHGQLLKFPEAQTLLTRIISRAGDLHRLEQDLSELHGIQNHENVVLESATDPAFRRFDQVVDALHFRRVVDTHELRRVGKVMHHCVGAYDRAAMTGEVIIVVGYTSPDHANPNHPVACVELRPGSGTVMQYKLAANGKPLGSALRTARAYIARAGLKTATEDIATDVH